MEGQIVNLSCKTPGDFSSNGLQSVYISYHPADFEQMEKVADDILSMFNCAVFYRLGDIDSDETDLQDYSLRLREMKLFVVVVTTKYLTEGSFAKNWEYGFAVENNIPIIPIAVESQLEDFFSSEMNHVGSGFGEIQLLSKYVLDKSAIPYRQKLRRDLEAFLIDNKEIERIKNAFDSKIFLSYRKKDRKYANELMRSIHSIHSLQNASIWYDEFISTGEKWSNQIYDALDNCDLFLLMISPFIGEPDNYVITAEYPGAVKMNKKIISAKKGKVEFKSVNQKDLQKLFPGLKILVDGDNISELEAALKELTVNKKTDNEKSYLIGVAYLNGINVEKDHEKAVSLILASAQNGFPDAVCKLSEMYWKGDGVPVNYESSVSWKKKLVSIYEKQVLQSNDPDKKIKYIKALESLATNLYELSAYRESLLFGMKLADLLSDAFLPSQYLYLFASAYDLCGKNSKMLGLFDDAIGFEQKYCELMQAIYESSPTIENYHNTAVAYERMGDAYYAAGNMSQGKTWYLKSYEINVQIHEKLNSIDSAYGLSTSCIALGDICLRNHDFSAAQKYYLKAVDLRRRISQSDSSGTYQKELGEAILAYATAKMLQGDTDAAESLILESKHIFQELADRYGTIESYHALSVALNRYGKLCERKMRREEAIGCYTDSTSLRKKIFSKIRTAGTVYEYALSLFYRACAYRDINNISNAKSDYEEVIDLLTTILSRDVSGDWHYIFAQASYERFLVDTYTGKQYLQKAIDAWKWLTDKQPRKSQFKEQYDVCRKIYQRCYPE